MPADTNITRLEGTVEHLFIDRYDRSAARPERLFDDIQGEIIRELLSCQKRNP